MDGSTGPPGTSGRRARVRAWPAAGRDRLAVERAELEALERGVRLRAVFLVLMGIILAIAASNVLAGTVGLFRETRARPLTAAEQARYIQDDIARRWHTWPADMIFPTEVRYLGLGRAQQYARRVGLAPETSCGAGLDAPVGSVLAEHGCRTLLRATYTDQTSTFVFTVGIAVLPDEERRIAATGQLAVDDRVGVRPVAFRGTASESFGAAQRQRNGWVAAGPYLVFSTAGYADGRTRQAIPPEEILHSELWPTAQSITGHIARALGDEPSAVPQCTQGNVC
ncbi:hypothetical protein [Streptosporangium carneum]|uniref:Uncharacterized protein n=1 Tax=Streptosporangium carneum TaxID=47481 RepID=A0A9W6IBA1_9ACTN|nr:hypothetical protein [Streptosporangium carneum]GLK14534.1 hypothetical protein GCM10017600_79460 [Streptosporangium carneum]